MPNSEALKEFSAEPIRRLAINSGYWTVREDLVRLIYGHGSLDIALTLASGRSIEPDRKGLRLFSQLLQARASRTVRLLTNKIPISNLQRMLTRQPEVFLKIKLNPRFPKRGTRTVAIERDFLHLHELLGKQIEFLSRSLGATMAKYSPQTGERYLPEQESFCFYCLNMPALVDLNEESWCGWCEQFKIQSPLTKPS